MKKVVLLDLMLVYTIGEIRAELIPILYTQYDEAPIFTFVA